jgi:hypothetical protein
MVFSFFVKWSIILLMDEFSTIYSFIHFYACYFVTITKKLSFFDQKLQYDFLAVVIRVLNS